MKLEIQIRKKQKMLLCQKAKKVALVIEYFFKPKKTVCKLFYCSHLFFFCILMFIQRFTNDGSLPLSLFSLIFRKQAFIRTVIESCLFAYSTCRIVFFFFNNVNHLFKDPSSRVIRKHAYLHFLEYTTNCFKFLR